MTVVVEEIASCERWRERERAVQGEGPIIHSIRDQRQTNFLCCLETPEAVKRDPDLELETPLYVASERQTRKREKKCILMRNNFTSGYTKMLEGLHV